MTTTRAAESRRDGENMSRDYVLLPTCAERDMDFRRCGEDAEFILWGKLFAPEALGPRCYDHAVLHAGWDMPVRADQYAVYDLRKVAAALTPAADHDEQVRADERERVAQELEGMAGPWGGDRSWLTTGTKVAQLAAEIAREPTS